MDRYLIRYFLAVVDQGNFSRAAAHCHVSQPALSVGVAKLEGLVGTALLRRSNQRVELTEAGNRFLVHARRIEREFNLAFQAMSGVTPGRSLRVGLLVSIPGQIAALAFAQTAGPGSAGPDAGGLEIVTGTERELTAQLGRGRLDAALTILRRGEDRFAQQVLCEEGYRLVMPDAHRLATRAQIEAQELSGEVMIVRRHCEVLSETSRFFVERGVRPHFAMRSTNDERVLQMVGAGLGVTVMPACYAAADVASAPITGFSPRRTLGFQFAAGAEHLRADPHPFLHALAQVLAA